MSKFKTQEVIASMRKALQTPDLPDDLRERYQAILDKAEAKEILEGAMDRTQNARTKATNTS